jgi:hypothetical protein
MFQLTKFCWHLCGSRVFFLLLFLSFNMATAIFTLFIFWRWWTLIKRTWFFILTAALRKYKYTAYLKTRTCSKLLLTYQFSHNRHRKLNTTCPTDKQRLRSCVLFIPLPWCLKKRRLKAGMKRVIKLTVVIIEAYHCVNFIQKFYPAFLFLG